MLSSPITDQLPGPVDSLAASPRYTSILLSWDPAIIGNNIIIIDIIYEVQYQEPGEMDYTAFNVTETATELTGLKPQTIYTISVTAYTIFGAGTSTDVEIMTMPISECWGLIQIDLLRNVYTISR